jgi:hypothetical protein
MVIISSSNIIILWGSNIEVSKTLKTMYSDIIVKCLFLWLRGEQFQMIISIIMPLVEPIGRRNNWYQTLGAM